MMPTYPVISDNITDSFLQSQVIMAKQSCLFAAWTIVIGNCSGLMKIRSSLMFKRPYLVSLKRTPTYTGKDLNTLWRDIFSEASISMILWEKIAYFQSSLQTYGIPNDGFIITLFTTLHSFLIYLHTVLLPKALH